MSDNPRNRSQNETPIIPIINPKITLKLYHKSPIQLTLGLQCIYRFSSKPETAEETTVGSQSEKAIIYL